MIRVGCGSEGKGRSWYWCVMELDTCVGMLCEAAVPTPQYDAHHPKRGEWVCAHGSLAEVLGLIPRALTCSRAKHHPEALGTTFE